MTQEKSEIGMIGLGVMGRNLVLNMADHGFSVAGYDKDKQKVAALRKEARDHLVQLAENVVEFIGLLRKPRVVMMLVPGGSTVDSIILDLLPHLEKGDLVIDAGNSHFRDTNRRQQDMESKGLRFFGMGVSGGEFGARHGPSMMPGGPIQAYGVVRHILEACAARVDDEPFVTYLGPHSAGHYVKMVHNGIEYGIMQLLAESYDLLSRGIGLNNDELGDLFETWGQAELNSYLLEITAKVFHKQDENTRKRLIDVILDVARQEGTGMWTSQESLALQVPTPNIDVAVAMRNLTKLDDERTAISERYGAYQEPFRGEREKLIKQLRHGLYAAIIMTYAQGMAQLRAASQEYEYKLDLSAVARIWRGGCIIRSGLLAPIQEAYTKQPHLLNLLLDDTLGKAVSERASNLRAVAQTAIGLGIPTPGLTAALVYYDSLRAKHLPANLIQAQRDYFGSHRYERVDKPGVFHTEWGKE